MSAEPATGFFSPPGVGTNAFVAAVGGAAKTVPGCRHIRRHRSARVGSDPCDTDGRTTRLPENWGTDRIARPANGGGDDCGDRPYHLRGQV
jgi:hypothetical protein